MHYILGDIVEFKCDIKIGTFDGRVIEIIDEGHVNEPVLLLQHLIEGGESYHVRQSNVVNYKGNDIFDAYIAELVSI